MGNEKAVTRKERALLLQGYIADHKDRIDAALSDLARKYLTPETLLKLLNVALTRNPALVDCTHQSVLFALMDAGACGLDPSGKGHLGHLVPFKNNKTGLLEAQFIPGYKGVRLNLVRSGTVKKVEARVVYEGDEFRYCYGLHPELIHVPKTEGFEDAATAWAAIRAAYAIAWLANGETQFVVLQKGDLVRLRNSSRAKDSPAYTNWPDRMAEKGASLRLGREVDVDPDSLMARTLEVDDRFESGEPRADEEAIEVEAQIVQPVSRTEELKRRHRKRGELEEATATQKGEEVEEHRDGEAMMALLDTLQPRPDDGEETAVPTGPETFELRAIEHGKVTFDGWEPLFDILEGGIPTCQVFQKEGKLACNGQDKVCRDSKCAHLDATSKQLAQKN